MKKLKLIKLIASTLLLASVFVLYPIGASAEWKQDNIGWWYTEGDSWATGWRNIDGRWYYFYYDGYMASCTVIDGYTLGVDGAWIEDTSIDATVTTIENTNGSPTLVSAKTTIGWQEIDGKKYFFDAIGNKVISQWCNINGTWYYFDENGVMLSNTTVYDKDTGKEYRVNDDGSIDR